MTTFVRLGGVRGMTITALSGLLAAGAILAAATPASAQTTVKVKYPVTGSTMIEKLDATAALGPGTLKSTVNLSTGAVTASLTLPPATVSATELGLVPVTATTAFINDGPTTGTVNLDTGAVTTTSHITLQITSLTVGGIPVPVGNACESAKPATVTVNSQPGFSIVDGGSLSGTYTIPLFAHCLLETAVLNLTIPGPGNTITLTLGKAKVVG
jgi:hypothetical protein